MKIDVEGRVLHFKQPAGTSRGVYTTRKIWLVRVSDGPSVGIGECAPLPQLSCDDLPDYGEKLRVKSEEFATAIEQGDATVSAFFETLRDYPSMLFGFETALLSLRGTRFATPHSDLRSENEERGTMLFDTPFSRGEQGIPINGLVWMGTFEEMQQRIEQKLEQGFRCVKLKIGAIDFDAELELIKKIRRRFSHHDVELRVDANGAFSFDEALYKLELLSQYALHSIE